MNDKTRALYIGAVALLVRFHAAMGSPVEYARDKRRAFDEDGDPLARLAADFNAQDLGVEMQENGETWHLVSSHITSSSRRPLS